MGVFGVYYTEGPSRWSWKSLLVLNLRKRMGDEHALNSFTGSVLLLICFIYIMVDNNRGSSPLDRGDVESVLDSSGTQAGAVLLFDLVHLPLHPTWSSQNYLWQHGWGGNWKNVYNRDSCKKKM